MKLFSEESSDFKDFIEKLVKWLDKYEDPDNEALLFRNSGKTWEQLPESLQSMYLKRNEEWKLVLSKIEDAKPSVDEDIYSKNVEIGAGENYDIYM